MGTDVTAGRPRSYLFVPGDRPERFAKALACGADAVVLDLEDAVAAAAKDTARQAVASFLAAAGEGDRSRCVVRINDVSTPWFGDDLAAMRGCGVAALMVPKSESVATLGVLHEGPASPALLPLLETARGVLACDALAAAPGVTRLVFGTIDYALDMGLDGPLAGTLGLDMAAARLALASRAAGIAAPVAGVTVTLDDEAALRADFERMRAQGFGAKLCIHPRQVAVVHALLAPTAAELDWAQQVLAAAQASAGAAVQLDGRMVDKPVIERARRIVQRAG